MYNVIKVVVLTAYYQRWRNRWQLRDSRDRRAWYVLNTPNREVRAIVRAIP